MLPFLNVNKSVIEAVIAAAELRTSGEIRVCIESRHQEDIIKRAEEVFLKLGMDATADKNGVLLYVHLRDRTLVILGDEGINNLVAPDFWETVSMQVRQCFAKKEIDTGIVLGIMLVTEELARLFPYNENVTNELPNAVAIGDHI